MITDDIWEPTEDDVIWTRHELDGVEIGGTWSTGDCLFLRADETAYCQFKSALSLSLTGWRLCLMQWTPRGL